MLRAPGPLGVVGLVAALFVAGPAHASPETRRAAAPHSRAAENYYQNGFYADAIKQFSQAYAIDPDPTLLFNIAQSYKHLGSLDLAIQYFRRYLAVAPQAKDRADVERRIRDLEVQLAQRRPPSDATPGAGEAASAAAAAAPNPASAAPAPPALTPASGKPVPPARPAAAPPRAPVSAAAADTPIAGAPPQGDADDELHRFEPEAIINSVVDPTAGVGRFRILLQAGAAFPRFEGTKSVSGTPFFANLLSATYSVPARLGWIDLGIAGSYAPIFYQTGTTREKRKVNVASLIGAYAIATWRFSFTPSFAWGPSGAFGMMWLSRLNGNNPITADMKATAGAMAMTSLRLGAPASWQLGKSFVIGLEPAWTYSRTATVELVDTVSSFSWLTLNGLIGYQF